MTQVAELDRSNWIVVPPEFTGGKGFYIDPARLASCSAVERVGKEEFLGLNFLRNRAKDTLERGYVGDITWTEALLINLGLGNSTPSIRENTDYLKLLFQGSRGEIDVYNVSGNQVEPELLGKYLQDSVGVRQPWREEWFGAEFNVKDGKLYLNYNHAHKNDSLVPENSEPLDEDTLMVFPRFISLESWFNHPTSQGLPRKNVGEGELGYARPEFNGVGRFYVCEGNGDGKAELNCYGFRFNRENNLGVRSVFRHE